MPGNRRLLRNGSMTDRVEEGMRRLKVGDTDGKGGVSDEPGAFPDRPGEPDCIYYLRTGSCGYGSNCRFNHPSDAGQVYDVRNASELPERAGQPECGYYLKTGNCKYGPTCKYHHPKNRQVDVSVNMLGLPMRQDARPCPYYMRTGSCKYGYDCKFHHPQPASATNIVPAVGSVYGSSGSAIVPSCGVTLAELSAPSLPKTTYFDGSFLQLPQSYMPLFLSPSQGWSTYMGGVSPYPVTSVFPAPTSNGHLSVSHLPERPDQPECRYFMNHGSCKYGSDCKYHHPREKLLQFTSNSLGPLGLPMRPGQPVCSYYSLYGLCKYGPTCKFDHPLDSYSYAYSLSAPPLASAYTSSFPYRMAPVIMPSSNMSPAKPPKASDWIKKGATASSKNLKTKAVEDSPDQSEPFPHSAEASSEVINTSD